MKKFTIILISMFTAVCILLIIDSVQRYNRDKHIVRVSCDFNGDSYTETNVSGFTEEEIRELMNGGK